MTPQLRKLEESVFAKRYSGQLDDIREGLGEYFDERGRSWWQRFKNFLKPHFEINEAPPYQQIRILLLQTPENKQVELVNQIVENVARHHLNHHIEPSVIQIIHEVAIFRSLR